MPAPDLIRELVQRFEEQRETYKSKSYTETPVRRDFIDPFFTALGWDMDNREGYAEGYRDVIHEDRISVEGKSKSPDYSFRIGGARKFFVEAKQPSVSIEHDAKPAFQLRRYGWSGKLPVSILTDFEEFAVYDCTVKPSEKDPASKARLFFYTYRDYVEKWDEIAGLFSKHAILKGAFDRFADRKKRGTATVDDAFLADIELWRHRLAANILERNEITQRDLNKAVQMTIDRIIFLRICEDRGIEPEGRLEKIKNAKSDLYKKLVAVFKEADDRYNSGLFHFNEKEAGHSGCADTLTLALKIDDAPLREILGSLYFPNPYEFSVIPADILGQVYERFLGKVIEVTGKQLTIEEKPEVKKAGGVFYTPSYIVEYIVAQTVDTLLAGKTPKQVESLSILDPACGSGSFLIIAYQHLLDWHLDHYVKNGGVTKFKKQLQQTPTGGWRLSTAERKRILLNNIYGVDIDAQAVEVTKLSLLLKVLEGETGETISSQLKLFHERALPDLGSNIKCGNSLIGSDFYAQGNLPELSEDDHYRINVFDWKDSFAQVFSRGGFDAVIGNPPYIFARGERFTDHEKDYFYAKFKEQNYQLNTYPIFMEHSVKLLLRKQGRFGFITPNNWLTIGTLKKFRDYILSNVGDLSIINYGYKVFDGANVDTSTIIFEKSKPSTVRIISSPEPSNLQRVRECEAKNLLAQEVISVTGSEGDDTDLIAKMNSFPRLADFATVKAGLMAYEVGKGNPAQTVEMKEKRIYHATMQKDASYRRYLDGKDVKRYELVWSGQWLKYGSHLAAPRKKELYEGERILVRQIPAAPPYSIHAMVTTEDYVNDRNSMIIHVADPLLVKPILGLLNSKLLSLWFNQTYQKLQRGIFPQFKINELMQFPMALGDAKLNAQIAAKVDEIMKLLAEARTRPGHIAEARIKGLNMQLDELACRAFRLELIENK